MEGGRQGPRQWHGVSGPGFGLDAELAMVLRTQSGGRSWAPVEALGGIRLQRFKDLGFPPQWALLPALASLTSLASRPLTLGTLGGDGGCPWHSNAGVGQVPGGGNALWLLPRFQHSEVSEAVPKRWRCWLGAGVPGCVCTLGAVVCLVVVSWRVQQAVWASPAEPSMGTSLGVGRLGWFPQQQPGGARKLQLRKEG